MADKSPADLAAISSPLSRAAVSHFVDGGNSRGATVGDLTTWVLADSWTYASAVSEVDFIGLGDYSEIIVVARGITLSSSGLRAARVSSDNGSSFYSTSGDYVTQSGAGVESNGTFFPLHATSQTAARSGMLHIPAWNVAQVKPVFAGSPLSGFITQPVALDALRILATAGDFGAGSILVFGR